MVEILSEILAAFLGAISALLLREIFTWKGQGRNEAQKEMKSSFWIVMEN